MSMTLKCCNVISVICGLGLLVVLAARAGGKHADLGSMGPPRPSFNIAGDDHETHAGDRGSGVAAAPFTIPKRVCAR